MSGSSKAKACSSEDLQEYKRLRRVVLSRKARGSASATELLKEADELETTQEKYDFLSSRVQELSQGGPLKSFSETFKPGPATQLSAMELRTCTERCVVKALPANSVALRRTLAVYAFLRENDIEGVAPVPRLLKVVDAEEVARQGEGAQTPAGKAGSLL